MASFGENLKREREMRGVTLQEISAATKISVRFLEAVEAEDFGLLPGGIFTRSFIRTYAKYLGLDEELVLAEYQLVAQPKSEYDLSRLVASRPDAPRQGSRTPLLVLFLAVLLVGGGYLLFRYSHRTAEIVGNTAVPSRAPTSATSATASPPQQAAVPTPGPESTAATSGLPAGPGQGTVGNGTASPAAVNPPVVESTAASVLEPEGDLVLQVAATERSWVAVDVDGKTVLQRTLNPSEIQTLKAKESFDVTTGNSQGIVLTLNGETLKPLGRRGEVKSIHLTRNDVKKTSP